MPWKGAFLVGVDSFFLFVFLNYLYLSMPWKGAFLVELAIASV
jgi:hypothetical protein